MVHNSQSQNPKPLARQRALGMQASSSAQAKAARAVPQPSDSDLSVIARRAASLLRMIDSEIGLKVGGNQVPGRDPHSSQDGFDDGLDDSSGMFQDDYVVDAQALKRKLFELTESDEELERQMRAKRERASRKHFDFERDCRICLLERGKATLHNMACCGAVVHLICLHKMLSMRIQPRCTKCRFLLPQEVADSVANSVAAELQRSRVIQTREVTVPSKGQLTTALINKASEVPREERGMCEKANPSRQKELIPDDDGRTVTENSKLITSTALACKPSVATLASQECKGKKPQDTEVTASDGMAATEKSKQNTSTELDCTHPVATLAPDHSIPKFARKVIATKFNPKQWKRRKQSRFLSGAVSSSTWVFRPRERIHCYHSMDKSPFNARLAIVRSRTVAGDGRMVYWVHYPDSESNEDEWIEPVAGQIPVIHQPSKQKRGRRRRRNKKESKLNGIKRRRGRPRKENKEDKSEVQTTLVKRPRGRPRKKKKV